jgi:putative hydrolase of HD superfamily
VAAGHVTQDRLAQQLHFILEVDKLKNIVRRSLVTSGERLENDAEHSWHLALMAAVLAEHANDDIDVNRVIRMLLVHDIVEIDAGDAFIYDTGAQSAKEQLEREAADRIFALLPSDQAQEFRALWDEFEERETSEARYAAAIDRLQPLLLNHATGGATWSKYSITSDSVLGMNEKIDRGSSALWAHAQQVINDDVEKGYLEPGPVG